MSAITSLYTLPYVPALSSQADDVFESERWNKDSGQSLIMSRVCLGLYCLELTFGSHMMVWVHRV